jgi:2,3-bisphosphoglycerate-independent phosphoglycerate mutase
MKLFFIVIDGMGDLPIKELGNKTPLEFAETPNMDSLAREGKTGLMYTVGKGIAPESDVAVISILGYDPRKYHTGRGIFEATGIGLPVKNGDLALRCNFATVDNNKKRIIDRRVGRDLTAEEAKQLSNAVNEKVRLDSYSADFQFVNTLGHRGVLVIYPKKGALSGKITNTDPAYSKREGISIAETKVKMVVKKCKPTDASEEAKTSAKLVNEFTQKSHKILDNHIISKKRATEGKLKANIILTRDAGDTVPKLFNINEKYGASFACLADMPVERGIAKLAGMHVVDLPPPSRNLKEDCLLRVEKLLALQCSFDCFYIHLKGTDEPGHDGKFDVKAHLIAIVDEYFFGKLLPKINLENSLICVTADHSTPCKLKAHSDDPAPLLISGNEIKGDQVQGFSEKECRRGSLGILASGTELMPRLMSFLKT